MAQAPFAPVPLAAPRHLPPCGGELERGSVRPGERRHAQALGQAPEYAGFRARPGLPPPTPSPRGEAPC
jgi:hypothetical protein